MWKSPGELKHSVPCREPTVGPEWLKYTVDTCGKSEMEAGASEWAGLKRALIATKRAQRRESSMSSFNRCEKEQDGFRTPPELFFLTRTLLGFPKCTTYTSLQPLREMTNGIPKCVAREDIQHHLAQPPGKETREEGLLDAWLAELRLEPHTFPPKPTVSS